MPDPVDCWVSTYQTLQKEDVFLHEKMDQKKGMLEYRRGKHPPIHFEFRSDNQNLQRPLPAWAWDGVARQSFVRRQNEINTELDLLCQQIVSKQLLC